MFVWAWAGPTFLAAGALLVLAGLPKVLDPGDLVRALRSVGARVPPFVVRGFAAAEVVAGAAALVLPGRWSALAVALLHAGFTGFVLLALAKGGVLASCGCFGRADTPPTRSRALVTGLLALAALAVAVAPPAAPWWGADIGGLAVTVVLAGLVGFLAWQVIALLPTTTAAAIRSTRKA